MSGHAHNPGKLKQKNKKHKAPAKGKRFQKKMQGGKVQTSSGGGKSGRGERPTVVKRADRINQQVQARRNKIMEVQLAKRLGSNQGPPRIVALVPLTHITSSGELLSYITETNPSLSGVASLRRDESSNVTYTQYSNFKGNCIFVEARNRDANEYLEVCKMADIVLFVTRESVDPDINMVDDVSNLCLFWSFLQSTTVVLYFFNFMTNHSILILSFLRSVLRLCFCCAPSALLKRAVLS